MSIARSDEPRYSRPRCDSGTESDKPARPGTGLCRAHRSALACSILAVASCSDAPSGSSAGSHTVRDSSGVQIVTSRHVTEVASVDLAETLRIGVADGDPEQSFHLISGVAADQSGRVYVADQGTQGVRVFDSAGNFLRAFGGAGSGPGEFRVIGRLSLWGDLVHVQNLEGAYRGALFDTSGALRSTYDGLRRGNVTLSLHGVSGMGIVAIESTPAPEGGDGMATRTSSRVVYVDSAAIGGTLLLEYEESPAVEYSSGRIIWAVDPEGGLRGNPPLYEPAGSAAVDGNGQVYVAHGLPYRVEVYNDQAELVRRIDMDHSPVAIDDELVSGVLRRVQSHYDSLGQPNAPSVEYVARRALLPRVGYVPAIGTIRVSHSGWVWVSRPDLEADLTSQGWWIGRRPRTTHWDVFDPDGIFAHRVRVPPRFSLHSVTDDAAWGVARDEWDVEFVVRLSLPRLQGR